MYSSVHSIVLFYLRLTFCNLIMVCLGVVFIIFLGLRICWASWIDGFIIFIKYRKVWPWFRHIFLLPSLLQGSAITCILCCPKSSLLLCSCFDSDYISLCFILDSLLVFSLASLTLQSISISVFFILDRVAFISEFHLNLPYLSWLCSVF